MSKVQSVIKPVVAKIDIRMDVDQSINMLDRDAMKNLKATLIEKSIVDCLEEFERTQNLHPTSITLSSAEYSVLSDWNSIVAGKGWMSTSQKNEVTFDSWGKITINPGCNCKPGITYVQWVPDAGFYEENDE